MIRPFSKLPFEPFVVVFNLGLHKMLGTSSKNIIPNDGSMVIYYGRKYNIAWNNSKSIKKEVAISNKLSKYCKQFEASNRAGTNYKQFFSYNFYWPARNKGNKDTNGILSSSKKQTPLQMVHVVAKYTCAT